MSALIRIAQIICLATMALWLLPCVFLVEIQPGEIGVRQSAISGVADQDFAPGWRWRIPGVHKVIILPATYDFLDYTDDDMGPQQPLQIRTKDNNIVHLDVSVPVRILAGTANNMVRDGNHIRNPDGRYRFQRLAEETTVSVLRERLADLDSQGFYTTETRLQVAQQTLATLNESLVDLHLEAEAVLIRAVRFRTEYESQLQQIQLNEQNKLLDQAQQKVAAQQQELDNYQQGTQAQAAAREQDWIKRLAELERAYQVGFIDIGEDTTQGAARRMLGALSADELTALRQRAAQVFDIADATEVGDDYLLGIKNIEAETREYSKRVAAEASAIEARLEAEAEAKVAQVRGQFETRLNALLSSPAGRAYVAWKAAENIQFNEVLTFHSRDGIPAVLRLRDFAQRFMGSR
ncbi:MAG: SPFH domain-containing protein [Myxococcota bacterium]